LSGGQRQRLAIARSLITKPDLLILDEATSSLDSNSEQMITRAILELRGSTTLVVIAHRLSTVQKADKVVYIENGFIQAIGSFNEVRNQVPNFDEQAKLMGL
jgi:ABC-type multidrug transport system fused ATPase/permease subunit